MDELERALRGALTDERLEVPIQPDAVAAIRAGVRRRRRNRRAGALLATAAAVAAAIAIPVGLRTTAHDTLVPPGRAGGQAAFDVPWVDAPAPKPWFPPQTEVSPPPMKSAPCRADQLSAHAGQGNGATGMLFTQVVFRNVSGQPCLLVGSPQRVAATRPGSPDVLGQRGLHLQTSGVGGDLAPGKTGYLTIETDRDCPARYATPNTFPVNKYTAVAITLPSGSSLTVPMPLDVECGLRYGGVGISWPTPRDRPDPRSRLVAAADVPETVRAGSTLTYVVTLTNPSARAVSLRHCPGYLETLGTHTQTFVKQGYQLNCSDVTSIGAGQSVRYEMRMAIPAGTAPGRAKLVWLPEFGAAGKNAALAELSVTG